MNRSDRKIIALATAALVLATLWAYRGSFAGPFVFDDQAAIGDNPTIRHLGAIGQVLSPPSAEGTAVAGRPMVNLSLALNYAWGGLNPWGYHAVNLAIHILAGLTLFGIVRRTFVLLGGTTFRLREGFAGQAVSSGSTLRNEPVGPFFERVLRPSAKIARGKASSKMRAGDTEVVPPQQKATVIAFSIALLWLLHPLLTESVTSIIQRTESLMGLFYLLTLYCFVRCVNGASLLRSGAELPERSRDASFTPIWPVLSVVACALGMATKEVMVTAPIIVFLYDRTFVSGTFREVWRRHGRLHLALASTWLVLGYLVIRAGGHRTGVAGFGLGVTPWTYALTQCRAILLYLKLAIWPHPLVVDYGTAVATNLGEAAPQAVGLLLLLAGTVLALWRRPVLGFLGAWFFLILAPSSSVVPLVSQTIAEHRMYLPLAAAIALAVGGGWRLLARLGNGNISRASLRGFVAAVLILATALGATTARRNADYRSALALWTDTVAKQPDNPRAQNDLGTELDAAGRSQEAIARYQEALRLRPDYAEAHSNLGAAWLPVPERLGDATAQFQAALRSKPDYAIAHNNLGLALMRTPGRLDEAIAQFQEAIRLKPDYAQAHNDLGAAWSQVPGHLNDALAEHEEALRLQPDNLEAHFDLGNVWSQIPGHLDDAVAQYREAIRLRPDYAQAHNNLGNVWARTPGRMADAAAQYAEAVRIKPDYAEAHNNLGSAWSDLPGRLNDAVSQYKEALRLKPDYAEAHYNLANALERIPGRLNEAITQYQAAIRIRPAFAEAHTNLGNAWLKVPGHAGDAIAEYREVLRLQPDNAEMKRILAQVPPR